MARDVTGTRAVRIEGLGNLRRAFRVASREMAKDLDEALKQGAEPVRSEAQALSRSSIPRIGLPWAEMRVGIARHSVYVAPVRRSRARGRRSRPNLFGLLMGRALVPALERNRGRAVGEIKEALADMARAWGRV